MCRIAWFKNKALSLSAHINIHIDREWRGWRREYETEDVFHVVNNGPL